MQLDFKFEKPDKHQIMMFAMRAENEVGCGKEKRVAVQTRCKINDENLHFHQNLDQRLKRVQLACHQAAKLILRRHQPPAAQP